MRNLQRDKRPKRVPEMLELVLFRRQFNQRAVFFSRRFNCLTFFYKAACFQPKTSFFSTGMSFRRFKQKRRFSFVFYKCFQPNSFFRSTFRRLTNAGLSSSFESNKKATFSVVRLLSGLHTKSGSV